jgi:hypothetical protein
MKLEKLISMMSGLLLLGAFVLLALGFLEAVANATGYTIIQQFHDRAGRLWEFAAVLLIFVIAMQLRALTAELKSRKP